MTSSRRTAAPWAFPSTRSRPGLLWRECAATLLLLGAAAATPATAGPWGIEITGGLSGYRLSAVNDSLRSFNQNVGTRLGEIQGGPSLGLGIRRWADDRWLTRLSLDVQTARSKDGDIRYDIGPWSIVAGATHFFPSTPVRFGIGGAAGVVWTRGQFHGDQFRFETRGTGPEFRAFGEALWKSAGSWGISGTAGVRFARVAEIEMDEQGTDTPGDYSGVFVRLSLCAEGTVPSGSSDSP